MAGPSSFRSWKTAPSAAQASSWLKFLIEVHPDGIKDITAQKLFEPYWEWCADKGRSGVLTQTKFGRKLRKLTAQKGVEGSSLPIMKRETKTANRYDISPIRDFDLELFFGLTVFSEGFDPPPVDSSMPNPPPPDPPPPVGSPAGVSSVDSFSPPLHAEINGVGSKKGEKPKRKTPSTPFTPGPEHCPDRVGTRCRVGRRRPPVVNQNRLTIARFRR